MKGNKGRLFSLAISLSSILLVSGNSIENSYDEECGKAYLKKINADLQVKTTESVVASWAYESNITDENLQVQLNVAAKLANFSKDVWKETIKYPWKSFKDPDVRRQFQKYSVLGTAVLSPEKYERLNKIISEMQSNYGKAKICNYHNRSDCSLQLEPELTEILVKSRDPDELRYYWLEWRNAAGKPVRKLFKEYVDLSNEVAVLNNFTDNTEYWLKDYEADDFKHQVETLWEQVRPLYLQLHAYVRMRLREKYGEKHVTKSGPIPAHLLGNMWGQSWGNIFDFTVPYPDKPSLDVTPNMISQGYTPLRMFKLAEEFFTSLGLSPMPETFWKNSILEKPKDGRDLICHASAWDFYDGKDFRIKQCTRVTFKQLVTVHHEMGHVQYYLQYKNQPKIYKRGGNPGFHEAVGDVMALSVSTPKHLRKIGLLNVTEDDYESDINQLFSMALDKIAFLPNGFLMDLWRWSVFEGKTTEKDYNCKWWQLKEKYQGLSPSVIRTEEDFDPGAKYHIVGNVPYIRYFVSFIIQFQFHRSLCIAANEFDPENPASKPLHKCDIYQSKEAGALLKKMLKMGSSKPWPDAMEVLTGQRKMDAQALLDYFATLRVWLEKENERTNEYIGWESSEKVCGWEENQKKLAADTSSGKEGSLEDGNIENSYAELVQDNNYGVPDYAEEAQPFHHQHHSINENLYPEMFMHSKFSTNDIFLPSKPQDDEPDIIDIAQLKLLKERMEKKPGKYTDKKKNDPQCQFKEVPLMERFKDVFDVRSREQDMEKTKILNAILRDLHQIRSSKQPDCKNNLEQGKTDLDQIQGSEMKKVNEGNNSAHKVEGEKKNENSKHNTESVKKTQVKTRRGGDASATQKEIQKEVKRECVLEKAEEYNKYFLRIPFDKMMSKAKLAENKAEKMLKNINLPEYDSKASKINEQLSELQHQYLNTNTQRKNHNLLKKGDVQMTRKRRAQPNSYLLFLENPYPKDKKHQKKSYKEYHYNARTPVIYNTVVIAPGESKNDKPEDRGLAVDNPLTAPTNYKRTFSGRKRNIRCKKKKNVKRLSRYVKSKKFNINNIVQYFGLITNFVITLYFLFIRFLFTKIISLKLSEV